MCECGSGGMQAAADLKKPTTNKLKTKKDDKKTLADKDKTGPLKK